MLFGLGNGTFMGPTLPACTSSLLLAGQACSVTSGSTTPTSGLINPAITASCPDGMSTIDCQALLADYAALQLSATPPGPGDTSTTPVATSSGLSTTTIALLAVAGLFAVFMIAKK